MRALLLLVLVACQRTHDVTIQMGPNGNSLTVGFQCRAADGTFLAQKALDANNQLAFNVVVDLIDLGGGLPGCRGEELVQTCAGGKCSIATRSDGTRFCVPMRIPLGLVGQADQAQLVALVRDQLTKEPVTTDAPDRPVLIRSVATTEPCPTSPTQPFDLARVIGCAYSCPVVLDDISGPVSLSLDALDNNCEPEVRVCASFPP